MDVDIWKIFVSLGVPGLALGIFYMLFKTFKWEFPKVPVKWVAPIIILFMLLTFSIVFYALTLWAPQDTKSSVERKDEPQKNEILREKLNDEERSKNRQSDDISQKSLKPIVIQVKGYGYNNSDEPDLKTRKQEAFVAAILNGIKTLSEEIAQSTNTVSFSNNTIERKDSEFTSNMIVSNNISLYDFNIQYKLIHLSEIKEGKLINDKFYLSSDVFLGDFEIEYQAYINSGKLEIDTMNCNYKNTKILINQAKMIFPTIKTLDFYHWENPPKDIHGVKLTQLLWKEESKAIECIALFIFSFDPSKVKILKEKKSIKKIKFEYQKDRTGEILYKTTTTVGKAYGGDHDTPYSVKQAADMIAKRKAIEDVIGLNIQCSVAMTQGSISKEEILSNSMEYLLILDKKFILNPTSQGTIEVSCILTAKIPVMRIVTD